MEESLSFYCLSCNKLMKVDQAKSLFRTGFYRIRYPLGLCTSCNAASQRL